MDKTGYHYIDCFQWLWRQSYCIRKNVTARMVSGVLQVFAGLLTVWLSKQFIDVTIRSSDDTGVWQMVLLMTLVVAVGIALRQTAYFWTVKAEVRIINHLRKDSFAYLMNKQLYGEKDLHSGDVMSRLTQDVETVCDVMVSTLPQMVVSSVQVIGAFCLMSTMDMTLAWILLLMTPIIIFAGKAISKRLRRLTGIIRSKESHVQMLMQEGVENVALVQSIMAENQITEQLDKKQSDLAENVMRRTRFTVATRTLLSACFAFGYLLAFIWGGLQLRDGIITIGVMTSFLQLVGQIQYPVLNVLNLTPQLVHASVSVDRLRELECEINHSKSDDKVSLEGLVGVRMENVDFSYPSGDKQVLRHFSYDFKPGSRVALMGETGIGKTTIFRLMLALVNPDEGKIEVYADQKKVAVSELTRCNFVVVPQGNTLLSGTVRNNLLLANPEATDDLIINALQIAMADFVFALPNGLDTELGEHGIGLSEGQAQRIAIARGLLQPGHIMLFDEISSALDADTERELLMKLFRMRDKTMIFVTHRSDVAEICDEVINLWA